MARTKPRIDPERYGVTTTDDIQVAIVKSRKHTTHEKIKPINLHNDWFIQILCDIKHQNNITVWLETLRKTLAKVVRDA